MSHPNFRIFVSSPGDVLAAREMVAQVIDKVAHEYDRFFEVEPYLWEYEPMLATGHFQDAIEPPGEFDAVILILESRLGTPLPERTEKRVYHGIDGRSPVTGTEWEFENALVAARENQGIPDLLVYRSNRNAEISTRDAKRRQEQLDQIEALEAFWSRHFADGTRFIGAYSEFTGLEDLASRFERDLRSCLQRRVEINTKKEQPTVGRVWTKEPFRGLEAYEFEHSRIYFGRHEAVGLALRRLMANAQTALPFLLVLGASGTGKSSLVQAGVLPRLLVPQRVSGTAFLRRAIFRVSDIQPGEDVFDALARRLTNNAGEGIGIPELLRADLPVEKFAAHLRESYAHPDFPFATALDDLASEARQKGRMLAYEHGRLILVIDQLEELFTSESISTEQRARFIELLSSLARSGLVWIIATMRADFWHRAAEVPLLLKLADGERRLDLAPATAAELSQMIKGPADRAALTFESEEETRIPLNDMLAEAASSEPGTLPLLSYVLDQLYKLDVKDKGGSILTVASYKTLGGLKGAIATRANIVIESQPAVVQKSLRSVLFSLVTMSNTLTGDERAVARRTPLADFAPGTPKRQLIEALLDPSARLLVADAAPGQAPTVRLAHEALISEWKTARDFIAQAGESLKTRRMVEERYARWVAMKDQNAEAISVPRSALTSSHGLLVDIELLDAQRLLSGYRDDLPKYLLDYINASVARERDRRMRMVRVVSAVAVLMAMLALWAFYEARQARAQSVISNRTKDFMISVFQQADPDEEHGGAISAGQLLDSAAYDINVNLTDEPRPRAELLSAMGQAYSGLGIYPQAANLLKQADAIQRQISPSAESRVQTLTAYGTVLDDQNSYNEAATLLREAVSLARSRLPATSIARSEALTGLANVLVDQKQFNEAEKLCQEALAVDSQRPKAEVNVYEDSLTALAGVYFHGGILNRALETVDRARAVVAGAAASSDTHTAYLLNDLGAVLYQMGRYDEALLTYQQALPIYRRIFKVDNVEVTTLLNNIGRDQLIMGNVDAAEQTLRPVLAEDEDFEGMMHGDLVSPLNSLGMIDAYHHDFKKAADELKQADAIASVPKNSELLDQVQLNEADLDLQQGDIANAQTLLKQSQDLLSTNYDRDQSNAWRYAVWDTVNAELLAAHGQHEDATRTLAAARAVIVLRYGPNGFYTLLTDRRAHFVSSHP